jgi:hypothetical protein
MQAAAPDPERVHDFRFGVEGLRVDVHAAHALATAFTSTCGLMRS